MSDVAVTFPRESARPSRWVVPLWVIWVGLLFGGMILNGFESIDSNNFLKATRLTSSVVLVLAAFCFLSSANRPPLSWPLLMIAVGMTFGLFGDISNSQILIHDGKTATMGGIITFAIGHLAYMTACWAIRKDLNLRSPTAWWASMLFWQLAGIIGWAIVVYPVQPREPVHWAALPYSMLLAGTAGMTTALAVQNPRLWIFGLGGALFLASDLVLAVQLFQGRGAILDGLTSITGWVDGGGLHFLKQISENACWLLYGPGQMCLVYAAGWIIAAYRDRSANESID